MRLFIFGAGSSRGTLGLPTVAGFGRALAQRVSHWRTKFGALAQVVDALEPCDRRDQDDWNLDAAWSHVDYVAKLHEALETAPFASSGSHGLHAAVVTVYGDIGTQIAHAVNALDDPGEYTIRDVLRRVVEDDCVVSFNYDTLVESLLVQLLTRSDGPKLIQAPRVHRSGAVHFAKPHGSVTWNRYARDAIDDNGGPKLTPVLDPAAIMQSEFETDAARKVDPLVVGAVPMKSELIMEVGQASNASAHPVVMKQWRTFLRAIAEADELCVIGYSFPPEDAYGRFLIRQAARRRQRPIHRVELYELDECVTRVRDSIVQVLGVSPRDVAFKGSVKRCPGLP
jgi:hypothetical protein